MFPSVILGWQVDERVDDEEVFNLPDKFDDDIAIFAYADEIYVAIKTDSNTISDLSRAWDEFPSECMEWLRETFNIEGEPSVIAITTN